MQIFIIIVIVSRNICHTDHTLNGIWQLYIHPPGGQTGNSSLEILSDKLFHILSFLHLLYFTLCIICTTLQCTCLLCHLRQDLLIMLDPLLFHATVKILLNDPVNLQIWITADRRSKMTIILHCQAEMSLAVCSISRLLHRTKRQSADQSFLRFACNSTHQFLNLLRMDLILLDLQGISKVLNK